MRSSWRLSGCLVLTSLAPVSAPQAVSWQDPSKHRVQFATVEDGVPQPGGYQPKDAEERAAVEAFTAATAAYVERWKKNLQSGVPEARFVDLPGAGHYVFLSREAEVLRGLQEFVAGLH